MTAHSRGHHDSTRSPAGNTATSLRSVEAASAPLSLAPGGIILLGGGGAIRHPKTISGNERLSTASIVFFASIEAGIIVQVRAWHIHDDANFDGASALDMWGAGPLTGACLGVIQPRNNQGHGGTRDEKAGHCCGDVAQPL